MNGPRLNVSLAAVSGPPIARALGWAAGYDGRHGPLIDCCQAVPSHPPAPDFATRLAKAAGSPDPARYGAILGDAALREAYAAHVSDLYGAPVRAERVAMTAGCNQAFFVAAMALACPGDALVLPTPWYFSHAMTLAMLGIEARALPTRAEDGFLPDPDALEAVLDERCRALVIISPNNPTGAVHPPARLAALFEVCQRRGIAMVLDETYRDFLAPGAGAPHGLFGLEAAGEHLFALYSFSKAYAIPGHRVGAIVAGRGAMAEIEKVLDCLQICAPRPAQAALPWAIVALEPWRRENAATMARRVTAFETAFATLESWEIASIGAYFAYVRHPHADRRAEEVAEALVRERGVLTLPGSFFGPGQEAYLRIAFANVDEAGIMEIGRRLGPDGLSRKTAHG